MIAALEKARDEVGSRDRMPAENRAEIAEKIAAEIARLRSQDN
jgi:hypothetical protein